MNVGVVGSRTFFDYKLMREVLDQYEIDLIVSGGAKGADHLAERYAEEEGIEILVINAKWIVDGKYLKAAGFIRNRDIVDASDMIIAFWDGKSKGTKHSIDLAQKAGKEVIIIRY